MDIGAVMDDLGAALEAISGLRVAPYYADRVNPPQAIVGWPDPLTYDATYGRGSDSMTLPVLVVVGRFDARSARDNLAKYANGSGEQSIKAKLDTYEATAYDVATVTEVTFGPLAVAGVDYLAATFTINIVGQGG